MAKKKFRYFIYNDLIPSDFTSKLQCKPLDFESSYALNHKRSFRENSQGLSSATLIHDEGSIEFGYTVVVYDNCCELVESILSSPDYSKKSVIVGFGEGDQGRATAFVLKNPGKVKFPDDAVRKKIAFWTNLFWPRIDKQRTEYFDIKMR